MPCKCPCKYDRPCKYGRALTYEKDMLDVRGVKLVMYEGYRGSVYRGTWKHAALVTSARCIPKASTVVVGTMTVAPIPVVNGRRRRVKIPIQAGESLAPKVGTSGAVCPTFSPISRVVVCLLHVLRSGILLWGQSGAGSTSSLTV
jgi:hypothetical protein